VEQKDFYQILGVDRKATQDEIRMAYRKLAFQFHPDRNKDQPEAAMRMKEINESYAVISDKTKRAQYDAIQQSYGRTAYDHFREKYSEQDIYRGSDIHRIFEEFSKTFGLRGFDEIFREAYGPGFQPSQEQKNHAPGASDSGYHTSEAMAKPFGGTLGKFLKYSLKKTFGLKWPEKGKNRYDTILVDPKVAFLGGKIKYRDRREKSYLVVKIPARVSHGQQIRLRRMGAHGKNGGERGDLYIKVHLQKPLFQKIKGGLQRVLHRKER
jgi:DnaJ-class molecular chaperone